MWRWRLLSTHQLYFHFGSSILGSLFSTFPEGRVTVSFSDSFHLLQGRVLHCIHRCIHLDKETFCEQHDSLFQSKPRDTVKDWLYPNWENSLRTMKPKYNSCLLNLNNYLPLSPKFYQNLVIKLYYLMHMKLGQSTTECQGAPVVGWNATGSEQIQLTTSTSWKVFLLFTSSTLRPLILISSGTKARKGA